MHVINILGAGVPQADYVAADLARELTGRGISTGLIPASAINFSLSSDTEGLLRATAEVSGRLAQLQYSDAVVCAMSFYELANAAVNYNVWHGHLLVPLLRKLAEDNSAVSYYRVHLPEWASTIRYAVPDWQVVAPVLVDTPDAIASAASSLSRLINFRPIPA
jgi:hypothetical protein